MSEQQLDDGAFIIRFGTMRIEDLRDSVDRCFAAQGFHGLSFYGENRLTPNEIAALAKKPHRFMRKAQAGRLRAAGFEVRRSGRFHICN